MFLGTSDASLSGNMLAGKGATATRAGKETIRADDGIIREGQDF